MERIVWHTYIFVPFILYICVCVCIDDLVFRWCKERWSLPDLPECLLLFSTEVSSLQFTTCSGLFTFPPFAFTARVGGQCCSCDLFLSFSSSLSLWISLSAFTCVFLEGYGALIYHVSMRSSSKPFTHRISFYTPCMLSGLSCTWAHTQKHTYCIYRETEV